MSSGASRGTSRGTSRKRRKARPDGAAAPAHRRSEPAAVATTAATATATTTTAATARAAAVSGPAPVPHLMSPEELAAERRRGLPTGASAVGTVALTIAAVPIAASGPRILAPAGSDQALLLGASLAGSAETLAMWCRVASVLLVIPVALYLSRCVRSRNPDHARWIAGLGIVAFVIVGISTAVGFTEIKHAAHVYVQSGPRTAARAHRVLHHQQAGFLLGAANLLQVAGGFLFGVWISIISYEAMRVGLLTRFLGFFGVGAGLTTVIGLPIGPALFVGWLGSVALLAVGYWPGGVPPAWTLGRSVPPDETDAMMAQTGRRRRYAG